MNPEFTVRTIARLYRYAYTHLTAAVPSSTQRHLEAIAAVSIATSMSPETLMKAFEETAP